LLHRELGVTSRRARIGHGIGVGLLSGDSRRHVTPQHRSQVSRALSSLRVTSRGWAYRRTSGRTPAVRGYGLAVFAAVLLACGVVAGFPSTAGATGLSVTVTGDLSVSADPAVATVSAS
jgi:hypothetical protein